MTSTNPERAESVDRRASGTPVFDSNADAAAVPVDANHTLRTDVVAREKEEFGGF